VKNVVIVKKLGMLEIDVMRLSSSWIRTSRSYNKLVGKKALANTELCDEVADEEHGSKKNRKTILYCLNKTLVSNYLRLTRHAGCFWDE